MNTRFAGAMKRAGSTRLAAVMAFAVLLAAGDSALARPRASVSLLQEEPLAEIVPAQRGGGISLAQATAMARSRFPGRVVRAETVRLGDRAVHEIRILGEDGRTVRTVRIDAQTGSFL